MSSHLRREGRVAERADPPLCNAEGAAPARPASPRPDAAAGTVAACTAAAKGCVRTQVKRGPRAYLRRRSVAHAPVNRFVASAITADALRRSVVAARCHLEPDGLNVVAFRTISCTSRSTSFKDVYTPSDAFCGVRDKRGWRFALKRLRLQKELGKPVHWHHSPCACRRNTWGSLSPPHTPGHYRCPLAAGSSRAGPEKPEHPPSAQPPCAAVCPAWQPCATIAGGEVGAKYTKFLIHQGHP